MSKMWVVFFLLLCVYTNVYASENNVVFLAALKGYCTSSDKNVLQNKSVTITKDDLKNSTATLNSEAIISLSVQNQEPQKLEFICEQLIVLSEEEIDLGFKNKPLKKYPRYLNEKWAGFFEKYSEAHGILKVSMPGYSSDRKYAVIYITSACGPLCGNSSLIQLKKLAGVWVVEKTEEQTRS